MEFVYLIGALILLAALICGSLNYTIGAGARQTRYSVTITNITDHD